MSDKKPAYISIWFFIGTLLGIYGILILVAGILSLSDPPPVALKEYHASFWWGILLTAMGIAYCVRFRPGKVAGPSEEHASSSEPEGRSPEEGTGARGR
ncbi:MAG: hypothetical protein ACUVYA_01290 [Planctomycetota bacterium]